MKSKVINLGKYHEWHNNLDSDLSGAYNSSSMKYHPML
ncbi:unnamed protein product [Spirodela intermedia]|uniref:Uncharacterized protein n=1 Tax=Spirodela intermedia TaxID=51605 RepID=A0ABN7E8G0_SPIIN|nr:unnamed protein product [Spirodela intermedia]